MMVLLVAIIIGVAALLTERTADERRVALVSDTASQSVPASSTSTSTTSVTTTTVSPVDQQLDSMSIDAKAGQVLVAQFSGQPDDTVLDLFRRGIAGSVFVTGRSGNVGADRDATTAMISSLQDAAANNGIGLLVATDQEGGRVQRVETEGVTPFPPADRYGSLVDSLGLTEAETLTRAAHQVIGTDLALLGLNVDFAPVADVNDSGAAGAIGNRSFSADPATASTLTAAAVEGLQAAGVAATAKHFPGHGPTAVDSHEQLPVVEQTIDEWRATGALPFVAAIDADVALVMVGHLFYPALDPDADARPASLSPASIDVLRGELGFDGVVVTDDLAAMAPVADLPIDLLVVDALNAGVDLLLTPPDIEAAHAAIVAAVTDGRVDETTLDAAAGRVLALKHRLGVLDPAAPPPPPPPDVDGPLTRLVLSNACAEAGVSC